MVTSLAPAVKVENVGGTAMVSSLNVSEVFEKQHKNVLQTIEGKIAANANPEFCRLNFQPTVIERPNPSGGQPIKSKSYNLTRDGFTFIAFGFTGKKADEFKIAYIEAFNRMESMLRNSQDAPDVRSSQMESVAVDGAGRAYVTVAKVAELFGDITESELEKVVGHALRVGALAPGEAWIAEGGHRLSCDGFLYVLNKFRHQLHRPKPRGALIEFLEWNKAHRAEKTGNDAVEEVMPYIYRSRHGFPTPALEQCFGIDPESFGYSEKAMIARGMLHEGEDILLIFGKAAREEFKKNNPGRPPRRFSHLRFHTLGSLKKMLPYIVAPKEGAAALKRVLDIFPSGAKALPPPERQPELPLFEEPMEAGREKYHKICEVAGILNVSTTAVNRLIRAGEMDTIELAGQTRIRQSEVDRYIARCGGHNPAAPCGTELDKKEIARIMSRLGELLLTA